MGITQIVALLGGLALFLYGMKMMSDGLEQAAGDKLKKILEKLTSNRFLGVAVGAGITAIIQSSSASVGILQALSSSGAISLSNSVYVLFGQNIGTCLTAVLASVGTCRNARRTTIIHLMFNIIGTTVFVIICQLLPFASWIEALTPQNTAAQIANVHTIFNLVTTAMLLPFGEYLEKAARKILPEIPEEKEESKKMELDFISPSSLINHTIGSVSVAISQIHSETARMYQIAVKNVEDSFNNVMSWDEKRIGEIEKNEEYVDFLNAEISKYISTIMSSEMTRKDALTISSNFQLIGNIERISDHAVNISDYSKLLHEKGAGITDMASEEVEEMKHTALKILHSIDFSRPAISSLIFTQISLSEERIDKLTEVYRSNQLDRMKNNECRGDISVIYSEMITDFERIGDHMLNIAECMMNI